MKKTIYTKPLYLPDDLLSVVDDTILVTKDAEELISVKSPSRCGWLTIGKAPEVNPEEITREFLLSGEKLDLGEIIAANKNELDENLIDLMGLSFTEFNLTIPNETIEIETGAFDLPNVGSGAIIGCKNLNLSDNITSIGSYAFRNFGMAELVIPKHVTTIELQAFDNCSNLASITIPDSVTSIGNEAFAVCTGLTSVTIPNSVKSIGSGAFRGCSNLVSINIPSNVESIGDYIFDGCNDDLTVLMDSPTIMNSQFTRYRTLENIIGCSNYIIGDNITTIKTDSFGKNSGDSQLLSVTIGKNVSLIYYEAFYKCNNLNHLVWDAKNCSIYYSLHDTIFGTNAPASLTSVTFGENVEVIPAHLCAYMSGVHEIVIPENVIVGDFAFTNSGITKITFPNTATLGSGVCSDCVLSEIHFTGTLELWCQNTYYITLMPHYTSEYDLYIGEQKLVTVNLPSNITTLNSSLFYNCKSIEAVQIPAGVVSIGNGAFSGCKNLTTVLFGEVELLEENCFDGCKGLVSITLPSTLTSIKSSAFGYCNHLTTINYNGTTEQWNNIEKETNWDYLIPATVVHCTDGDVSI